MENFNRTPPDSISQNTTFDNTFFADPHFNIGFKYDKSNDARGPPSLEAGRKLLACHRRQICGRPRSDGSSRTEFQTPKSCGLELHIRFESKHSIHDGTFRFYKDLTIRIRLRWSPITQKPEVVSRLLLSPTQPLTFLTQSIYDEYSGR
jgi:hypothetical protein